MASLQKQENRIILTNMKLNYTYEMDGTFYVGYLDDYPEHPTQGETLEDFEGNLIDIFNMVQDGTLEVKNKFVQ